MTVTMTITSKGQVTFPKKLLTALEAKPGDRLVARIERKRVIVEPLGRGILDLAGKLGKLTIPKGKTVDDLIHEARDHIYDKELRRY